MDTLLGRQRTRLLGFGLSLVALCLATGEAIARYPPTYILAATAVGAGVAVAWWNRGVFSGILVLLLLQGVPVVNTQLGQSSAHGANALNDAIFVALALFLAACAFDSPRNSAQTRLAVLATIWGSCYLAWWSIKVAAGSPGIPLIPAVKYGREFMGVSIFLPIALLGLRRRTHLVGFAGTLAVGAALFSLGQIITQVAHKQLAWLIHVEKVSEFEGVTRIYAPMNDLLIAAFPMAFAAMMLAPRPWRRPAMLVTVLTGLANALSFTRAVYVSELLALFLISLVWARGLGWRPRRIRHLRRTLALGVSASVFAIAIAGGSPATSSTASSPLQAVVSRAQLGVNNIEHQTGTTGYRLHKAHLELEVLGDNWVAGLGFLNPSYHYVPSLREGSIRDDDLGSLNIMMTMGLIGLLLAYMPPIGGLVFLLRRRRSFVQYGGAMYLSAALVGSVTLATISSPSGLLVLGSMLAFCVNWTVLDAAAT
jgi:hypothetical protein